MQNNQSPVDERISQFVFSFIVLRRIRSGMVGAQSKVFAPQRLEYLKDFHIRMLALGAEHTLALSGNYPLSPYHLCHIPPLFHTLEDIEKITACTLIEFQVV